MTTDKALSLLVYGPPKSGKTTLAMTGPAPRLLLDVEKAARFLKTKKVYWNPMDGSAPPKHDGTWDTCVVTVHDFQTATKAFDWLRSGKHEFNTVILDSISELQVKAQEDVNGRSKMQTQHWGELLSKISFFGRDLRDLSTHPIRPVECVIITATERIDKDDKGNVVVHRPFLQGGAASQIPYWFDVCGYYYITKSRENGEMVETRNLLISNHPQYIAGNRVPGLPEVLYNPNIKKVIDKIFADE